MESVESMESGESKESLRLRMKSMRTALRPDEIRSLSGEVARRLMGSPLLNGVSSVALYASVRNEVETQGIFEQLRRKGVRTFFPRVAVDHIDFIEAEWEGLTAGRWGIPEPHQGNAVVPAGLIEAVLVPGLAFDEAGGRLGYGQGYYDRALKGYGGCRIALAYDFQLLPAIPRSDDDLVCNWIVTDRRILRGVK